MAGTNQILPFCPTDNGSNLLSQSDYAAATDRTIGNQPGVASSKLVNKALRQSSWIANQFSQYIVNKTGSDVLDDENSTTIQALMAQTFAPPSSSSEIFNLALTASVGASAMTIALKTNANVDASTSDPVYVSMRSATLTSGLYLVRTLTGALSITIPSGATLGQVSNQAATIWVYLIDNAGTLEFAVSGTQYTEASLVTTTTISGSATSSTAIYSTTGRTNVALRLVGKLTNTQTTAGTWAAVPSQIQLTPFQNTPQQPAYSFGAKTSAYTVLLTDQILKGDSSGGAFQFTLPAAATASGKQYIFIKTDSSFNAITIAGSGAETINGSNTTTINTQYESLTITCDGTAWYIMTRRIPSAWVNNGNNVITAVTTAPVQTGNTKTIDAFWWRRNGTDLVGRIEFKQTAAGTSTAGSGDYLFQIVPTGLTVDTSKITVYGGTSIGENSSALSATNAVGSGSAGSGSGAIVKALSVFVYDSTKARFGGPDTSSSGGAGMGMVGSTYGQLSNTSPNYVVEFSIPITGWNG